MTEQNETHSDLELLYALRTLKAKLLEAKLNGA